jgi:hypothetical protein
MTLLRPWTLEALSAMIHTTLIENIASAITQKEKKKYEEKYETLGLEKLLTEGMFLPVDSKHYALNF